MTANEHCAVFPELSIAVQVAFVVPTGNVDPEGGLHTTFTPGQLSDAVAAKLTTLLMAGGHVASAAMLMLAGHVIIGG